ncbi:hypothetical protein [Pantoea agglomerans]|uniref:hypothetical protein n=1 Tax=Enterobacter agglomerans TaxID=549 RepID=UPI000B3238CB|nr:hypothetical protein [Pantoea agglomerans]
MDLETVCLKLEPYNDSHYKGLRIMDSDNPGDALYQQRYGSNGRRDPGKYQACSGSLE